MLKSDERIDDPLRAGAIRLPEATLLRMRDASGWTPEESSTLGHSLAVRTGAVKGQKDQVASAFNSAI